MRALRWRYVTWETKQLCAERNDWRGHVSTTKGGRPRHVPVTTRLAGALREHRHLRGSLVLTGSDGGRLSESAIVVRVRRAARQVGLENTGRTFCATRSVLIWRCVARPRERFKSSPAKRADDDAAVHAPERGDDRSRHSAAGNPKMTPARGDIFGDGKRRNEELERLEHVRWCGRKDLNLHDLAATSS